MIADAFIGLHVFPETHPADNSLVFSTSSDPLSRGDTGEAEGGSMFEGTKYPSYELIGLIIAIKKGGILQSFEKCNCMIEFQRLLLCLNKTVPYT